MHCLRSFSCTRRGAGPFRILNRKCLCSYFARRLFCQCTNIPHKSSFVSSAFILTRVTSLHGGPHHLLPPTPGQEEAFLLTALVDWLCACTGKKNQSLFSQCIPTATCQQKCFSIGLADQVCFCRCECVQFLSGSPAQHKKPAARFVLTLNFSVSVFLADLHSPEQREGHLPFQCHICSLHFQSFPPHPQNRHQDPGALISFH